MTRVAVLGGSGYIGGELLRLLLGHPRAQLSQVIARRAAGTPVGAVHPNLRGVTPLRFTRLDDLAPADVICSCLPHGALRELYPKLAHLAPRWIDLAADHRLADPTPVYGWPAGESWQPGIPELHAAALATADRVAVPGCMATAAILALAPLADLASTVVIDALTGSSGAGVDGAAQHAERAGAMRVYAPTGHRHAAEIRQALGLDVAMTVTAVEPVRGILVKAHVQLPRPVELTDLRRLYSAAYRAAPFVRIVAGSRGQHRYPDPRWLAGSNFCDIGFALDGHRLVVLAAIDNLVKGGAGTAVQALNLMHGWPERDGLHFPGLHPI